ncbi:DUF302 domain-containing protein [Ramlibacter sp. WS9]|uniref:DUF302 domain-containing protein n=1 Tax=Ramlibacter sp. WS9 TaxID=1882741 RepID=UPI001144440F|nr:DUF302 domain-containing protein [Ramlibacter sp. WS9]ROZ75766.1 DUF302 domain-containing protein [Ramlibacter sp. WS9]
MTTKPTATSHLRSFASAALIGLETFGLLTAHGLAAAATQEERVSTRPLTVEHIRISSKRSFDDVKTALESRVRFVQVDLLIPYLQKKDMAGARAELERLAAPTGLSILYSLNHGAALAMDGRPRKAVGYGIGNVLTAVSMNKHDVAAGLYAPIRVILYEGADGTAVFEYDRPSSMFGLLGNASINSVAGQLDAALKELLMDVGK